MGPAGASWHHDGPGNVDHIMWVIMAEDGPQMGNIALKGIFEGLYGYKKVKSGVHTDVFRIQLGLSCSIFD